MEDKKNQNGRQPKKKSKWETKKKMTKKIRMEK